MTAGMDFLYDCQEHGIYDAGPGDLSECLDCRKAGR